MNNIEDIINKQNIFNKQNIELYGHCDVKGCVFKYYIGKIFACKNCDSIICCYCTWYMQNKCIKCTMKTNDVPDNCEFCIFTISNTMCWKCGKYVRFCCDYCQKTKGRYRKYNENIKMLCFNC